MHNGLAGSKRFLVGGFHRKLDVQTRPDLLAQVARKHTPVSQDVPVYWQVHTCAMQAEVFISTERYTLSVDVLKLRLLCASTASASALLRGPSSCSRTLTPQAL